MIPSASSFPPGWPIIPDSATTPAPSSSDDQERDRRREARRLTVHVAAQLQARMSATFLPPVEALVTEGLTRLRSAIKIYRSGRKIDDLTAVQLGLDLQIVQIRDEAWIALDASADLFTDLGLWEDLTKIVDKACLPPISSLVAFMAWRRERFDIAHDAALAALKIDPSYDLAHLVHDAVHDGIPPSWCQPIAIAAARLGSGRPNPSWMEPLRQKITLYTQTTG
ncbi:DUF4192 family protein [Streptosporangium canum]|uniref:DUF4192 family protein n=1 Tax=Streptosporangium canum TaxID=324952 RepID=UPI0036936F16